MATTGGVSAGSRLSPLRALHDSKIVISSSPDEFPSIDELLKTNEKKKKQPAPLRSVSHAAPVPEEAAAAAFTSVWREALASRNENEKMTDVVESAAADDAVAPAKPKRKAPAKPRKPREPRAEKPKAGSGAGRGRPKKVKEVEKPELTADEGEPPADAIGLTDVGSPAAEKPWKKFRLAPESTTGDDGSSVMNGEESKPAPKKRGPRKKADTTSRHFPPKPAPVVQSPKPVEPIEIDDSVVELPQAIKRRKDWTPPVESKFQLAPFDSPVIPELLIKLPKSQNTVGSPTQDPETFRNLMGDFGCNTNATKSAVPSAPIVATEVLGKRKLIEMVATTETTAKPSARPSVPPETSPVKSKAPKKKPRTITDLATAAYRPSEEVNVEADANTGSLLNYFAIDAEVQSAQAKANEETQKTKPTTKDVKKPSNRVTKKKAASKIQHLLLSPTSAMVQVAQQDYVFGTASQLATEEDPAFLRAVQEAMAASNKMDPNYNPFASSSPVPAPRAVTSVVARKATRKLWGAGARDDGGDLVDVEVIDLVDSPIFPKDYTIAEALKDLSGTDAGVAPQEDAIAISSSDIEADASETVPKSHFFATQTAKTTKLTLSMAAAMSPVPHAPPKPPLPTEMDVEPPASNQEQQIEMSQPQPPRSTAAKKTKKAASGTHLPSKPKYELFTDAQLAKEISSYGFKAVKKRAAMISLLEQCWESKNKAALGATAATGETQAETSAVSPSRPRGRPRKDCIGSGAEVEAEAVTAQTAAVSPKRPRGRPRKERVASGKSPSISPKTGRPRKDYTSLSLTGPTGRPRRNSIVSVRSTSPSPRRARPRTDTTSPSPKGGRPLKDTSRSPSPSKLKTAIASPGKRPRGRPKKADLSAPPSRPKPPLSASTPKRGRPRKHEVADSDADLSDNPFASSPPSSPDEPTSTAGAGAFSPGPQDLSITSATELSALSLRLSPTAQQAALHEAITTAVTSAPRTTDPSRPSWHEKMLMYDPIILEDLAAWLNAGQLTRVGWDGEVHASEVKRWCESRGVCCVWRVNMHGKERKRVCG